MVTDNIGYGSDGDTGNNDRSPNNTTTDKNGSAGISNSGGDNSGGTNGNSKRRGRPKGSKTRNASGNGRTINADSQKDNGEFSDSTDQTGKETISVQDQKPRKRRKTVAKTIENPAEVAETTLAYVELLAIKLIGEEGRFDTFERLLLEIGAQDVAARVSPETAAKVAGIVSPVCLIAGVALYGFRIAGVLAARMEAQQNIDSTSDVFATQEISVVPPTNGFNLGDTIIPPYTDLRVD